MPKKIIKKKSSSKKKNTRSKKRLIGSAQWGKEFEKLAHRRPLQFNFIRSGVSGDPFCGHGVPDVEGFGHPSSVVDSMREEQLRANARFSEMLHRPQMVDLKPNTRGELGTAPAHYSKGRFTPWEVIDDWKLDYYCGNAVKYVCRHKHKGKPVEDIQKAIDCLIKYKHDLMDLYATQKKINTIANFMDMDKETK